MTFDVFLSYKRADQGDALRLRDGLAPVISCWMDHDIPPAASWADAIRYEMCACYYLAMITLSCILVWLQM